MKLQLLDTCTINDEKYVYTEKGWQIMERVKIEKPLPPEVVNFIKFCMCEHKLDLSKQARAYKAWINEEK